MPVQFQNFSVQVTKEMEAICAKWLEEAANEIQSHAQRNCQMTSEDKGRLKGSYSHFVDDGKLEAYVGTPLESGYWEEFGTGEYADTAKNGGKPGRDGWWVYVKDGPTGDGGESYNTEDEARAVAESMRRDGLDAYHTNGRQPNYTLEKAFKRAENPARQRLEQMLKEGLEE
jgi:hypothetical protein